MVRDALDPPGKHPRSIPDAEALSRHAVVSRPQGAAPRPATNRRPEGSAVAVPPLAARKLHRPDPLQAAPAPAVLPARAPAVAPVPVLVLVPVLVPAPAPVLVPVAALDGPAAVAPCRSVAVAPPDRLPPVAPAPRASRRR